MTLQTRLSGTLRRPRALNGEFPLTSQETGSDPRKPSQSLTDKRKPLGASVKLCVISG